MQVNLVTDASQQELPLFPLHVVLFPGGILPLHIFEQRYRLMIQFCLEHESPFGVVLIKKGQEVGGPAEPHLVGTAAQIIEIDRLTDGQMNLITSGQYRFEIMEIQQDRPYLVGRVRVPNVADMESNQNLEPIAAETRQLYQDYESLLGKLLIEWETPKTTPDLPRHLAYQIGTRLQIPMNEKQKLLETFPTNQLLKREIALLKRENQRLRLQLAVRNN